MTETLVGPFSLERDIKKSRFLARATPIASIEEAEAFIASIAAAEPDATHHCWAWQFGPHCRCHDAGEPSGTAGRPILQVVVAQKLDRVAIVVSRWFGGIKLGAGGLVRAYAGTAAECLREAPKEELIERVRLGFHCPFSLLGLIQARLPEWGVEAAAPAFDANGAWFQLVLPQALQHDISAKLTDLTSGQADIRLIEDEAPEA
ncbi:IMPACT family protein [Acetobacter okinawensis]|uniref:IMPACT family protein n=1 Tax=Acetobacter okinawensis TaxID=1076594 RepID=UPI0020A010AB|nr:YigZ family protein [Acetobacter okinawensis]MCP1212595.1 IMPACT family protein [Acetobacter okinawensis]